MDRAKYLRELHARFGVGHDDVFRIVRRTTGGQVAATRRLVRGDENEVHRVRLADGSVVYLRISFPGTPPSKTHHEAWAMGRAREAGVPVPAVLGIEAIDTDDGERTAMVVRAATGRQLNDVLPALSPTQRFEAMAEVGRVLQVLHSIPMPGTGVPDGEGVWADLDTQHRRYVANCLAASEHLAAAGLTPAEVRRVVDILEGTADVAVDDPVLCHGDVSPEHVFVDSELRMVGLIDWGMWHAGSAVSELAGLALTNAATDLDAIMNGHGMRTDTVLSDAIAWHMIARATGQIAWLVGSGQTAEVDQPAAALRRVLADRG